MNWKAGNYLIHRWLGILLGVLVFVWFGSGIVMIYYPWPAPTPSEEFARLQAFQVAEPLIGYSAARDSALGAVGAELRARSAVAFTGGRLMAWRGRLTYALWTARRATAQPTVLVDARTGSVVSPISDSDAVAAARKVMGADDPVASVSLLSHGDHYLMSSEYQPYFPAYRVAFADASHAAVYVSRASGYVVGLVTDLTRWTTWFGTVPHWLYFEWLYDIKPLWLGLNYLLPAIAVIAGLSGIVIGIHQLWPHWRRGVWRLSAYRGMSRWHHLSGIVFGALVVTWSLSAVLEVMSPPASVVAARVAARRRATPLSWSDIRVSEAEAARRLTAVTGAAVMPVAVDLVRSPDGGSPGYVFHLGDGRVWWVDAGSGAPRRELDRPAAVAIAVRAMRGHDGRGDSVRAVDRLTRYDAYYYARRHRERPLPVWRVSFGDRERSTLYVDGVTGEIDGTASSGVRVFRWLKDGLHSFDFPALNANHVLWEVLLLVLMSGGTVAAFTGLWLVGRRLKRMA